jgi:hypothetical protein
MIGPGKYDAETTVVRERIGATAVVLIVVDGKAGSGFSVQAPAYVVERLPTALRVMADEIERTLKSGQQGN